MKFWQNLFCLFFLIVFSMIEISFASAITFTPQEREYIASRAPINLVVDPDWYPYEEIDELGKHSGISAELIALIASRTGLTFKLLQSSSWDESIQLAKSGKADLVSFLNQTDERSKWLVFSLPYYSDPNVLITRESHDYISNLARVSGETVVLPEGTSIEERLRKDYPNLKIITVQTEDQAVKYVDEKKAEMTLRSLTMAAYVIKNKGFFNLKIAGEVPAYNNHLRIGITKNDVVLQSILNKAIATITEQERQAAINKHISLKIVKGFDYKLFIVVTGIFSFLLISSLFWSRRIQSLNKVLQKRQHQLFLAQSELKDKNQELLNINLTKDKFFSIIAHDLRGPIGSMAQVLEVLDDTALDEARKKRIYGEVKSSAKMTFSLLENLLKWSMLQKGEIICAPVAVALHPLVSNSIKLLSSMALEKNIKIINSIDSEIKVIADEQILLTILRNLLSNALKFTPKHGTIELFSRVQGSHQDILVIDNGVGMSQEQCARLFLLANKMSTPGTEGEKGTGLGLILCKEFVTKLDGKIAVESQIGKGSRFIVTLLRA